VWSQPSASDATVVPDGRSTSAKPSPTSSYPSPRKVVFSVPSCPWVLSPQQPRLPSSKSAQVWFQPASICATYRPVGNGHSGIIDASSRYASPMEPSSLQPYPSALMRPKHNGMPSLVAVFRM